MHAVIFEVLPLESGYQRYLNLAAALRPHLEQMDGFISIERFRCLNEPGWILSFSLWRDEAALAGWRAHGEHRAAQSEGRASVFRDYRLRVADLGGPTPNGGHHVGVLQHDGTQAFSGDRLFESLASNGRRIALCSFASADEAIGWQQRADGTPQTTVLCGPVLRDYGMFDRAQAPQVFPPVQRSESRHG